MTSHCRRLWNGVLTEKMNDQIWCVLVLYSVYSVLFTVCTEHSVQTEDNFSQQRQSE